MKNLLVVCVVTVFSFLGTAFKPNWAKVNDFLGVKYPKFQSVVEPQVMASPQPTATIGSEDVDLQELKAMRVKYQYLPKEPKEAKKHLDYMVSELDRLIMEYDSIIERKKQQVSDLAKKAREPAKIATKEPLNDGNF